MRRPSGFGAPAEPEDHRRRASRAESWPCSMPLPSWTTCESLRATAWKNLRVTARGSTAYGSTISTGSAPYGGTETCTTWRSPTITESVGSKYDHHQNRHAAVEGSSGRDFARGVPQASKAVSL